MRVFDWTMAIAAMIVGAVIIGIVGALLWYMGIIVLIALGWYNPGTKPEDWPTVQRPPIPHDEHNWDGLWR